MSHPLTPRRRSALDAVASGNVRVSSTGSYRNRGGQPVSQGAARWLHDKGYIRSVRGGGGWDVSVPVEITDDGREALRGAR